MSDAARDASEPTPVTAFILIRLFGAAIAVGVGSASAYAIAKLYTGRGGETPVRSALIEQPLLALIGLTGISIGMYALTQPHAVYAARRWLNPVWVWRHRRAEAALLSVSFVIGLLVLEAGSRFLYARAAGLPFFYPVEYAIYPQLYTATRKYAADEMNVLLLGGSVLYGVGFPEFHDAICEDCAVHNLATPAHSSLDSRLKLDYLLDRDYRFDAVVFYHGINETRANNVPPDIFADDYSHYFFYRLVHTVFGDRNPLLRTALHSALVFRVSQLMTDLRQTRMFGRKLVHIAYPREDWLQYGSEIKSRESFEENLVAIADQADAHGIEFVVFEFAYDPVLDAYAEGESDAPSREEMVRYTEQWGLPEHVRAGMLAHNDVMREHADRYRYVPTADFFTPDDFVDPCHLTDGAKRRFAERIGLALPDIAPDH